MLSRCLGCLSPCPPCQCEPEPCESSVETVLSVGAGWLTTRRGRHEVGPGQTWRPGERVTVDCAGRVLGSRRRVTGSQPRRSDDAPFVPPTSRDTPQRPGVGHVPAIGFGDNVREGVSIALLTDFPEARSGRPGFTFQRASPPLYPHRLLPPLEEHTIMFGNGDQSSGGGGGRPDHSTKLLYDQSVDRWELKSVTGGGPYTAYSETLPNSPSWFSKIELDPIWVDVGDAFGVSSFYTAPMFTVYDEGNPITLTYHYEHTSYGPISLLTAEGGVPEMDGTATVTAPGAREYSLRCRGLYGPPGGQQVFDVPIPKDGIVLAQVQWTDGSGHLHAATYAAGPPVAALAPYIVPKNSPYPYQLTFYGGLGSFSVPGPNGTVGYGGSFTLGAPLGPPEATAISAPAEYQPVSNATIQRFGLPNRIGVGHTASPTPTDGGRPMPLLVSPVRGGKGFVIGPDTPASATPERGASLFLLRNNDVLVNGVNVGNTYTRHAALSAHDGSMTLLLWDEARIHIFPGLDGRHLSMTLADFLASLGWVNPYPDTTLRFMALGSHPLHWQYPLERCGLAYLLESGVAVALNYHMAVLKAYDAWYDASEADWRAVGRPRPKTRKAYEKLRSEQRPPGPEHGLALADVVYANLALRQYDLEVTEHQEMLGDRIQLTAPPELPSVRGVYPYLLPATVERRGGGSWQADARALKALAKRTQLTGWDDQADDRSAIGAGEYRVTWGNTAMWRPQFQLVLIGRMSGDPEALLVDGSPAGATPLGHAVDGELSTQGGYQSYVPKPPKGFFPFVCTPYVAGTDGPSPPQTIITVPPGARLSQLLLVPAFSLDPNPPEG